MNLNDQKNKCRALNDWFLSAEGKRIQLNATQYLSSLWPKEKNGILLQLGHCGDNHWLKMAKYPHKWIVTPCLDVLNTQSVIASPFDLPFKNKTISLIFAPLSMELFFSASNELLFELDRVLAPMGHIIFLGINPLSLWALRLRYPLVSDWGLKQKLFKKGYAFESFQPFYYLPPWCNDAWFKKLFFLNDLGHILPVMPSGFYLLMLQKYEKKYLHSPAASFQWITKTC